MKIRTDIQLTSLRVPGIIICASTLVLNTSLVNSGPHTECLCYGFNGNLKIYKDVPVSKIGIYPSNALAQVSSLGWISEPDAPTGDLYPAQVATHCIQSPFNFL